MKILQIMPRIPAPPHDGGAIYVYHITKHLAMRGHELVMASFESNRHRQDHDLIALYCRLYSLPAHFKPYTVSSILKSTLSREPVSVQHRMDVDLMNQILSLIPDTSFDIISIEGIHTARFIDIVKSKYPNTPLILRQANVEHLLLKRNAQKAKNPAIRWFLMDQARLMKRFETKAMQTVDGVTTVTPVDQNKFLELIPDLRCEVVPGGAYLPEKRNTVRDDQTLLAVSNWDWRPNKDGLVWFVNKIWPQLKRRNPNISFEIAGHGIHEQFHQKLKRVGITYLGFVDDIEACRQKATILVAPLLSGSGLKLKVLEGLASGIPIITTSIGAEGIDMLPNQHYLLAETPHEFVKQTERLLNDQILQETLSKNGRTLIEQKYQWDPQAERLEMFMKEIIDPKNVTIG